jgi:hypothetical protein
LILKIDGKEDTEEEQKAFAILKTILENMH